jgi:hypothetical protein
MKTDMRESPIFTLEIGFLLNIQLISDKIGINSRLVVPLRSLLKPDLLEDIFCTLQRRVSAIDLGFHTRISTSIRRAPGP